MRKLFILVLAIVATLPLSAQYRVTQEHKDRAAEVVKKMTHSDDDDEVEDDDDLQAQLDRICIEQKEMRERKRAWKNSIRMNKVTK